MPSVLESLRLLSEPTRLRLLLLLKRAELTVAELQEILSMKQSRISTQLALLKGAALVQVRRSGKNSLYSFDPRAASLRDLLLTAAEELPDARRDRQALELALRKRADHTRAYFDQLAGKFGRSYCPGRSWKGLAEALLLLMPQQTIADLGAGEGTFAQLLARRAAKVIAVDSSPEMIAYGSRVARENGCTNLEFVLGDIESPPLPDASVDLAFFSQTLHHAAQPARAVQQAWRITRPGGRIVVLDLLRHDFEQARDLYADVWPGFGEAELYGFLDDAGYRSIHISTVDREKEPPHFQTLMAVAEKPGESEK